MTRLSIDVETRSRCDLLARGLHAYARDPSTQVLIFCYAIDDAPIQTWLPHQGKAPADLRTAIKDVTVEKWAYNANFEAEVIEHTLGLKVENWRDTMIAALYASLPASLAQAGVALGLPEDMVKNPEGKRLIRRFSIPRTDGGFNDWNSHPDEFDLFVKYCMQDVEAERAIRNKLSAVPVPESEWVLWELDRRINMRGIPVDLQFVENAIEICHAEKRRLVKMLTAETGLANPMTQSAFLGWATAHGYPFGDLRKATVETAIRSGVVVGRVAELLALRSQAGKTSMAKFDAIKTMTEDGRVHNTVQFYGASRTGRWSGRGVQVQNMSRGLPELEGREEYVTDLVKANDYDGILMEFGNAIPVVTSVVRSSFRAPEGKTFYIADLNAIENRVLGWLADCRPILDVFHNNRCPYLSFATYMFHQPYEELEHEYKVLKQKTKRTAAKPAVLGAGFGISGGEETKNKKGDTVRTGMWGYADALGVSMSREQAHESVRVFREAYPEVVQLWYELKDAAFQCVRYRTTHKVGAVTLIGSPGLMRVQLPSGRCLNYIRPRIEKMKRTFQRTTTDGTLVTETKLVDALTYEGMNQVTRKWERTITHGAKITENLVQGIARDILAAGLVNAEAKGFETVLHCHDEIVAEVPNDSALTLQDLMDCMTAVPAWARGMPLAAAGEVSIIYRK